MSSDFEKEAELHYAALAGFGEMRSRDLLPMMAPYTRTTDQYGTLVCRIVLVLGHVTPKSKLDAMTRDLAADVFDFLHEGRGLILRGMLHVAYPLLRRAFESLCLMVASTFDPALEAKWLSGDEVKFAEVRTILSRHPMGENEAKLKEAYRFFSETTHPRRGIVADRHLGDGNAFVLGAIGHPELILLADYGINSLNLWFWFGAVLSFTYRELLVEQNLKFFGSYDEAAKSAKETVNWLTENYNRLLAEYKASPPQT